MEEKKYESKRIERRIPLHFLIGLNVALGLTFAAFEWKGEDSGIIIPEYSHEGEIWDPPIPIPPPPPPVPPKPIQKVEIKEVIEDPIEEPPQDLEIDVDAPESVPEIIFEPEIEEKPDEAIHDVVQVAAKFPGGWAAFYEFVGKKMKYPAKSKRMGIEGKLYVQFVIEKDGSLTAFEVVRGLASDCDAEAIRVLDMVPNFEPARHNGKKVRQRMILPIHFKLR